MWMRTTRLQVWLAPPLISAAADSLKVSNGAPGTGGGVTPVRRELSDKLFGRAMTVPWLPMMADNAMSNRRGVVLSDR